MNQQTANPPAAGQTTPATISPAACHRAAR